jgi:hypothetical protein
MISYTRICSLHNFTSVKKIFEHGGQSDCILHLKTKNKKIEKSLLSLK